MTDYLLSISDGVTKGRSCKMGKEFETTETKKDRLSIVQLNLSQQMLPKFYQTHLRNQLKLADYLTLSIIINLLQSIKQVNLEKLATAYPLPIKFESRRRKLQRFLSLPQWNVETIWLPLINQWLEEQVKPGQSLYIAIDRTRWKLVNILFISVIWNRRAIPLYFELLPKQGNSNLSEQTTALVKVLSLLKKYHIIVLGDREFCSVDLARWLREMNVCFCLRLKKSHYIELENQIWIQLKSLELRPGMSCYLRGTKVTKTKQAVGFDLVGKWQRKYRGTVATEGWFILTNLGSLDAAIKAYTKRFGIEEMFRDFKKGGYNLEGTNVNGQRLISLLILIAIAYTISTTSGQRIKRMGIQKYVGRVKENGRTDKRHSSFYLGFYGETWLNFWSDCAELVMQLMEINPSKHPFYQRGLRAKRLIQSCF
jgi:hypothetical protein